MDTRPSDIIMRVRYSLKIKKEIVLVHTEQVYLPLIRGSFGCEWRQLTPRIGEWTLRNIPIRLTAFLQIFTLSSSGGTQTSDHMTDKFIFMDAESLLRIKTEMTSTQRRDNLNIIYNHAKLMHFYMLI